MGQTGEGECEFSVIFPLSEIMIDLIILDHNFQNREQSQWRKLKGAVTVSDEITQLGSNQVQRWICYEITRMIKVRP